MKHNGQKFYHPCKETCSGYKQGFEDGKEELEQRIKDAEEVLKYYSEPTHWNDSGNLDYDMTLIDYSDASIPSGLCDKRGGKRARDYFEKYKSK